MPGNAQREPVVLIVDVPSLIKASRQSDQPAAADETVLERIAS